MRARFIFPLTTILLLICPNHAASQQAKQEPSAKIEALFEAAGKGDARSQCELAKAYLYGLDVRRNYVEAVNWFRRAADQGLAEAQGWIGVMYDHALGVTHQYAEAVTWYRKAAEKGDASAQLNLGLMYNQGKGVRQNYSEAAKWYRRAAEQGNAFAQFTLGWMYVQGMGVTKNNAEAAKWFRQSAEKGDASAQCVLGTLYVEGKGISQDPVQAHLWLDLCATATTGKKQETAAKFRDEIARQMKPQQIAEAQRLAKELDVRNVQIMGNNSWSDGKETILPVALFAPNPQYTEKARASRAQGIILVQCIVRKDGTVNSFEILKGLGYGLDQSAINTIASKWRFKPGTIQGEPVDVQTLIEVVFKLY